MSEHGLPVEPGHPADFGQAPAAIPCEKEEY